MRIHTRRLSLILDFVTSLSSLGDKVSTYDTAYFNHQVLDFDLSKSYNMTMKALFDIVRSLAAWLALDPQHVAIVQCTNGKSRSGVAISCYLQYSEIFDNALEGNKICF